MVPSARPREAAAFWLTALARWALVVAAVAATAACSGGDEPNDDAAAVTVDQPATEAGDRTGGDSGGTPTDAGGDAPESSARIVDSLPESIVQVSDPAADSRADRIDKLAESVGATLEGDVARIVVEESVLFEFGSAELLDSAAGLLDDIADLLLELEPDSVEVVGHTDSIGTDEYNLDLSQRRADAVTSALIERGIGSEGIEATGAGEADPVAPNENPDGSDNPDGRARNRRVEITAQGGGGE